MFLSTMKILLLLLIAGFLLGGELAGAAEVSPGVQAVLPAAFYHDLIGNRDRIIQAALVAVGIGILILMWK